MSEGVPLSSSSASTGPCMTWVVLEAHLAQQALAQPWRLLLAESADFADACEMSLGRRHSRLLADQLASQGCWEPKWPCLDPGRLVARLLDDDTSCASEEKTRNAAGK